MQINLEQNSPEWLQFRQTHIGASDISSIIEVSPWKTLYQLWTEKKEKSFPTFKPNAAMKYGTMMEPIVRDMFIAKTGVSYSPQVHECDVWNVACASLDGISFDGTKLIEIKCPNRKVIEMARNEKIPEYYFCQIQWSLLCTKAEVCSYICYDREAKELIHFDVKKNEKYQNNLLKKAKEFWESLQNDTPPEDSDEKWHHNTEADYINAANEYIHLSTKIEHLKTLKEEVKKKIVSLVDNKNTRGAGLKVCYCEGKATLNQAKLHKDLNLTKEFIRSYSEKSKPFWTIKLDP